MKEFSKSGVLSIVLHAHMPFVQDLNVSDSLEERWIYEAITGCYLRFILAFDNLIHDKIPFRFLLSLSPPLISQLKDKSLPDRYSAYLMRLVELTKKEICRTKKDKNLQKLAKMYLNYFQKLQDVFLNRCGADIMSVLKKYGEMGYIDFITSSATHAYLPLLQSQASIVWAQIKIAVDYFEEVFGYPPKGIWLPECGYYPGLDKILANAGIRYFFLDNKVFLKAGPGLEYGIFSPFYCKSGVAVFGRNEQTAQQVWDAIDGYPGDVDYREFYRDIGYDLEFDYIKPFLLEGTHRTFTGIKYYRVTGPGREKESYDPYRAQKRVEIQVDDFLAHILKGLRDLPSMNNRKPIICALYDAELFGHWWFEGPSWLETLCRKIANDCKGYLSLSTPMDYLKTYSVHQVAQPPGGSWGWKGYNEVWLNEKNDWLYPHLLKAGEKMMSLAHFYQGKIDDKADTLVVRALNQVARELLMAQSSDWAFILNNNTLPDYATRRFKEHMGRFWKLVQEIENGTIDPQWLASAEKHNPLFPNLSFTVFNPL
ncbi:MAG: glycoside hydrolase family 57 protein [bacterium]